jgi:hypothetical protein
MTDTTTPETPGATDRADPEHLSPRDESRLRLSGNCLALIDHLLEQVPIDPDAQPGALLAAALEAQNRVNDMVENAVIAERERDTSYEVLGRLAGMTKQSAHRKWAPAVSAWARTGRTLLPANPDPGDTPLRRARLYDTWYAGLCPDGPAEAVSSGLDAVRVPGSEGLDRARRERADALHQRRQVLDQECGVLAEEYKELRDGADAPRALMDNLRARADRDEEMAGLYEQLVPLEPALADEHRADAATHRGWAQNARDHAEILAERAAEPGR